MSGILGAMMQQRAAQRQADMMRRMSNVEQLRAYFDANPYAPVPEREAVKVPAENCRNCGAPRCSGGCSYCGTP